MSARNKVVSNATWNLLSGLSGAFVAIVSPPFIIRALPPAEYGAWALALQIGTYLNLMGFGLQVAVGRYVAQAEALNDRARRDGIVSSAIFFLLAAAALGVAIIWGVAAHIERLLPAIPASVLPGASRAAEVLGLSFAILLPTSILAAVFSGLQQSGIAARIILSGRILLTVGLIVGVQFHSLIVLAFIHLTSSLLITAAMIIAWRLKTPEPRISVRLVSKRILRELASFCFSLTVWNLAMLLISGLDLIIVGRFDFQNIPYYAVATTVATFVAGTLTSLTNALIPAVANISEQPEGEIAVAALFVRSQRVISAISVGAGGGLVLAGPLLLRLWVGEAYAVRAYPFLVLLVVGNVVRTTTLVYATVAIGLGEQKRMLFPPIIEGVVSFASSIIFALYFGAIGVAAGTIVGGIIGVSSILWQHALGRRMITVSRVEAIRQAIMPNAFAWAIVALAALLSSHIPGEVGRFVLFPVAAVSLAVWMAIFTSLERKAAWSFIARFTGKLRAGSSE